MAVLGVDVLVYVKKTGTSSPVLIGGQRGASLEVSKDTIEVTSKGSVNGNTLAKEFVPGWASWSVSCDGLIVDGAEAYELFVNEIMNGKGEFDLIMRLEGDVSEGGKFFRGTAIANKFSLDAPYDGAMTYSVSFVGTGKLELAEV